MICSVIVYTGTARQYSLHSTVEMYEQAEPVRSPFSGPDSPQPSEPPPQPSPVRQSGSRGRARHGNGASDKQREDQDTSSHTYENAEEAKRYATSADGGYPGGASGRRGVCSFLRARRSFLAAGIAVLLSLCAVGLAPLTFSNKQEISQLKRDQDGMSTTVDALKSDQDALKRDQDGMSTTVDALKSDQDGMSATVEALKRDQDGMSTAVDDVKRDLDNERSRIATLDAYKICFQEISQLSTTVKRDLRQLSTTVDALKRDQAALKRDQDALKSDQDTLRRLSAPVDALKRDRDTLRRLSATVDALKRDQDALRRLSATVDALKRDQDDVHRLSATVDALKRDQDGMSTTVDDLKRDLVNERSRTGTLEKRLHEIAKTLLSCPEGYTIWRGICYKAFNTGRSFSDAGAACGADGGTLAMPRDADTNAFLITLYNSVCKSCAFWFGLHDQGEEGRFEWVDGSALGPYSSWGPGEPNDVRRGEDCVVYSGMPFLKDKWNDEKCHEKFRFICQAAPERP
ncbi:PREDICTED: CD209 antigen-like [Branchiostoma belcheri]|uniref:CD209 antigen-like n=1 Tax=Branchiostoma belcheri TaxID=7741 RepID=A0A6P4Y8G5_BRABE|nr:PREDICTED: CD209 antigen-like [Branchiostoma belcheri]